MTTNVTQFAMDLGELVLRRDVAATARARRRAAQTWPTIVGFTAGAALGAAGFAAAGLWSLALPAGLALLCLAMSLTAKVDAGVAGQ
jgi:uncharacterized membrane protein YoaK (UPF0700 family)